jgi:transposase
VKEQTYPTDLTGSKWDHIKELVPGAKPGGRRRTVEVREVINALLYVDNNGIKWRALPVMTRKANASCSQTSIVSAAFISCFCVAINPSVDRERFKSA